MNKHSRFEIERRNNLSYEEFAREYLYPLKPVIVTDALRTWPALKLWTPQFFKKEFGELSFSNSGAEFEQETYGSTVYEEFTLAQLIDRVMESTEGTPPPYLRNKVLSAISPRLLNDIQPLPEYLFPNWMGESYLVRRLQKLMNRGAAIELFIGGAGSTFPVLHYDGLGSHAFLMHIYGHKEFIVYPPTQEELLYPVPERTNHSLLNITVPDFERFPLFRKAIPTTFVLNPGEMLFIPSHWWHTTKLVTPSISLAVNVLNQSNWHELIKFVSARRHNPLTLIASQVYLMSAGAWRSWRDRKWDERSHTMHNRDSIHD